MTVFTDDRPKPIEKSAYRADIDGLRALAVASVVIYHAFPSVLKGGFVGVDIFFVISGFLISGIIFESLERNKFSFLNFYARRIRRIFPALILVLAASMACGWFLLLADEYRALGGHVAAGAAFVSNLTLWNEAGYFDTAAQSKPLLHLWSLAIEEQFYLFWPFLLWSVFRNHKSFLALTLAIAVVSFAVNIGTISSHPIAAFYSPLSRFWELMIGGILAYVAIHKPRYLAAHSDLRSWAGLAMIALSLTFLRSYSVFPGYWALLPTIGTFLILSAPDALLNRRVLGNAASVWIGLISYPLYLWHWPVLFLTSLVSVPSRIPRLIAVFVSVLLAALTYLLIEKPIRSARPLVGSAAALLAVMIVCGVLGMVTFVEDGFAFRLPQQFKAFAHLSPEATPNDCLLVNSAAFPEKCTRTGARPIVLIWGDSHANSVAAGFRSLLTELSTIQVTGASCPPLLGIRANGNTACAEVNNYALRTVQRVRPDIVILHAMWESDAYDLSKLPITVQQLMGVGARHIVLLGPVPRWNGSLLRSVFRCWQPRSPSEVFPPYSSCGLDPHVAQIDESLREIAKRANIDYISAQDALCKPEGCITHMQSSNGTEQLETYDYGHLSIGAAEYLVRKISGQLFANKAVAAQ